MKKFSLFALALIGMTLVSCSVEPITYKLADDSTLTWYGEENADHYHGGSLEITEGSLTMEGDKVTEGNFTIDMNSLKANADGMPAEKVAYLEGHLKSEEFFNTEKYENIKVKVTGYENGKLSATVNVLGVDLTNEIPVTLTQTESAVEIKGEFSIDISATNMPYLANKNEETGAPALNPNLQFTLDVKLKK